jgi:hypothetical protein
VRLFQTGGERERERERESWWYWLVGNGSINSLRRDSKASLKTKRKELNRREKKVFRVCAEPT